MQPIIKKINFINDKESILYFLKDIKDLKTLKLTKNENDYITHQRNIEENFTININHFNRWIFIQFLKNENDKYKNNEECRKAGDKIQALLNEKKIKTIQISNINCDNNYLISLLEGIVLSNYQFVKYKTDTKVKNNILKEILVYSNNSLLEFNNSHLEELNILTDAVYKCRDLVNEPVSYLNSIKLSEEIVGLCKLDNMKTEVLNKNKIESLKMGGLLSVNKGSVDPPTFTIIEYKHPKPKNKMPLILVGKGIVFDTGGINIKPGNFMEDMKSDMAGAATVACSLYAIAKNKLPLHIIGLIPATDNRPSGNCYVPGDVIQMHNGLTVEVKNTDAEGRMILADALSYAIKYKPELVIDMATLTGAASVAIGMYGIVAMHSKAEKYMEKLKQSGINVHERIVEFPFWEEYNDLIKSKVADIKNSAGRDAGAITAGKFLERFTNYPWIHLDIAGPAFVEKKYNYFGSGATAFGLRLIYDFFKNYTLK